MRVVRGGALPWVPSPSPGVERRILARRGEEVAVATSIVRYAPGSRFPTHRHDLGEEYLVLDGVFSDLHGDHGPGAYVRNPPGSEHAPWSEPGCVIFVRLRQFHPADRAPVDRILAPGPLHRFAGAGVTVEVEAQRLDVGEVRVDHGPHESFVIEGALVDDDGETWPRWTWSSLEPGESCVVRATEPCLRLVTRRAGFDPWLY